MIQLTNIPFLSALSIRSTINAHAIIMLVLHQDTWNTVLGNTRYIQVIRQNFVVSTTANPCFWCDSIYHLGVGGTHQCCNFLDLEFSSNRSWPTSILITFQTVLPLCKTCVSLKHSIMTQGFCAVHLLDHLKCFLMDMPNFWQNLTSSHCSNFNILDFHFSQTTTLHNGDFLSKCTICTQLLLTGTRRETCYHPMAPHICCCA
jgi:hypothetical protein